MSVFLKNTTTLNRRAHVVFLTDDVKKLPTSQISRKENDYVRAEFKNKSKTVLINQYSRIACVVKISDSKKESHNLLEEYRKTGCDLLARFNKAKAKQVVIVSYLGKPELTLAFVEGMALGNYQFLRYRKNASKERNSVKTILINDASVSKRETELMQISVNAVSRARDLVNEPQSYLTAVVLADEFVKLGKEAG
ncbi:MAG: hypothetical protein JJE25_15440, partial [Bacteroidia bacterium]|nr:hypothetical protein [Bacteroidia bacterium]